MTKKRTKPVVKEIFTDKPAAEIWTDEYYQRKLRAMKEDFPFAPDAVSRYLDKVIDDVLSGKIYVERPLDSDEISVV